MNRRSPSSSSNYYSLMIMLLNNNHSIIRRKFSLKFGGENSTIITTTNHHHQHYRGGGQLMNHHGISSSSIGNNCWRGYKTNTICFESKQQGDPKTTTTVVDPHPIDHSLVEALISLENSREGDSNLSSILNQTSSDTITEENVTSILNQKKIIDKLDAPTLLALMQFYARKGNVPKVKELYKHIKNPNEESKRVLVQLLALAGSTLKSKTLPEPIKPKVAKNLVKTMVPSNINVAHKRSISELKEVEDTLKKKTDSVSYAHSVVIEAFSIRGSMKQAENYFENIQHVNTEVLNSMIDGWIRSLTKSQDLHSINENAVEDSFSFVRGRVNHYFGLFDLYKIKRNVRTYAYLVKFKFIEAQHSADPKDPDINPIVDLIETMVNREKIIPDPYFVSTFLTRFSTVQSKAKVKKLYGVYKKYLLKVPTLTPTPANTPLTATANATKQSNVNNFTILSTLAKSNCIPEALSLFEHLKKSPLQTEELINAYEIMISMFLESDDEQAAILLMDEMIQKKIPRSSKIYFHVLNHFFKHGNHKAVSKYFQLLQLEGLESLLTPEILRVSLKSLALTRSKKQVMDILKSESTTKYLTEESCSAFIGAYGVLEELEEAERVFNLFIDTNKLEIYNEMLCTYVNLSCVGDAITLYLDFPMNGDIFTYETLVGALGISKEHSAIIQIHKIMIKLGIKPTFKYYDQLIDILTREPVRDLEVKTFLQSLPDEMSQFNIGKIEQLIMRLLF